MPTLPPGLAGQWGRKMPGRLPPAHVSMSTTMLKALTRGILPLVLFVVTAHGQTPQTKSPTFEVAAIAPAEPLDIVKLASSGNLSNLRIGANITETRADMSYMSLTNL